MLSNVSIGLGLMSGTSLDGVDLAVCRFENISEKWKFEILQAETVPYDSAKIDLLKSLPQMSGENLIKSDRDLGVFFGQLCKDFIEKCKVKPEFIASHGHTVFHNPCNGYTFQIGHSAPMAAITGLPVISDFRSIDVAFGGQGAPLVPIGDELLFSDFDMLVNLGGFSNVSYRTEGRRVAFDICPVNIALNYFSQKIGLPFDKNGAAARKGVLLSELLNRLNNISYYFEKYPKSLGREWFENVFLREIDDCGNFQVDDILKTIIYHVSERIFEDTKFGKKILFTGGGIKNEFLAELLYERLGDRMVVPSERIIDYKEALIFAFMGLLRLRGLNNTINSATGATKCVCSGMLTLP